MSDNDGTKRYWHGSCLSWQIRNLVFSWQHDHILEWGIPLRALLPSFPAAPAETTRSCAGTVDPSFLPILSLAPLSLSRSHPNQHPGHWHFGAKHLCSIPLVFLPPTHTLAGPAQAPPGVLLLVAFPHFLQSSPLSHPPSFFFFFFFCFQPNCKPRILPSRPWAPFTLSPSSSGLPWAHPTSIIRPSVDLLHPSTVQLLLLISPWSTMR
jgi:hypothetical protein